MPRPSFASGTQNAGPGWHFRLAVQGLARSFLSRAARAEQMAGALCQPVRDGGIQQRAFYRLPEADTFAAWSDRTPPDFVMAVKASRFLTHVKRLRDPSEPVARFLGHAAYLGGKLGPVLLQLPPSLRADAGLLDATLACFPAGVRVAVEPRHQSWFSDQVLELLRERGAAMCLTDRARRRSPVWRTAAWTYLRFHEGTGTPRPCYGRQALATWAEALAGTWEPSADVYVYFNNDHDGCAVRDAVRFAAAARRAGLSPTRTPAIGEAPVTSPGPARGSGR